MRAKRDMVNEGNRQTIIYFAVMLQSKLCLIYNLSHLNNDTQTMKKTLCLVNVIY